MYLHDITWAAGFYEGEGHLTVNNPPRIQVAQCNREPLDRLAYIFGGKVYGPERPKGARQDVYRWIIGSHEEARSFAYIIFPYLSEKKQADILGKIDRYADILAYRRTYCSKGHDKDTMGFIAMKNGGRICKTCRNEKRRGIESRRKVG